MVRCAVSRNDPTETDAPSVSKTVPDAVGRDLRRLDAACGRRTIAGPAPGRDPHGRSEAARAALSARRRRSVSHRDRVAWLRRTGRAASGASSCAGEELFRGAELQLGAPGADHGDVHGHVAGGASWPAEPDLGGRRRAGGDGAVCGGGRGANSTAPLAGDLRAAHAAGGVDRAAHVLEFGDHEPAPGRHPLARHRTARPLPDPS